MGRFFGGYRVTRQDFLVPLLLSSFAMYGCVDLSTNGMSESSSAVTSEGGATSDAPGSTSAVVTTGGATSASTSSTGADAPVAFDDAYEVAKGEVLVVEVGDGLTKNDESPGAATVELVASEGTRGEVQINDDGGFTYTPPVNYWGCDTFQYQISAGGQSDIGFVTISVTTTEIALADVAAGTNGFKIVPSVPEAFPQNLGRSLGGNFDFNRDGYEDIIVGAPDFQEDVGRAYILLGSGERFSAQITSEQIAEEYPGLYTEIAGFPSVGWSVTGSGDFNGDECDDALITATGASNAHGRIYIVYGGDGEGACVYDIASESVVFLDDIEQGIGGDSFSGAAVYDKLGVSSAWVGDVDGDGGSDIAVGANRAPYANMMDGPGQVYLVFGGGAVDEVAIFTGKDVGDRLGSSMGGGDFNDDGLSDFLIGSPQTGEDRVYYYPGGSIEPIEVQVGGEAQAFIETLPGDGFTGQNTGSAGDLNGDGIEDIYVTSRWSPPNLSGRLYTVIGGVNVDSLEVELDEELGPAGSVLLGAEEWDGLGESASGAGDVNGDGLDDLLAGSPFAGNDQTGAAFLVYGDSSPRDGHSGEVGAQIPGLRIDGESESDGAGAVVRGVGDLDGDGFSDFAVTASFIDDALQMDAPDGRGEVYVLYGGCFGSEQGPVRLTDPDENINLGTPDADRLIGSAGDETLDGHGGMDALSAGAGDDTLIIGEPAVQRVDGGRGEDTLVLGGEGLTLNLHTTPDQVFRGIEQIDLGARGNKLIAGFRDVRMLSDHSYRLVVRGGGEDSLELVQQSNLDFVMASDDAGCPDDGESYQRYTAGALYSVCVEADVPTALVVSP